MPKITVENEQALTERLTRALEREDYAAARRRLNDIRKQARNRYDYLRRKYENSRNKQEFQRNILARDLKDAERTFKQVAKDVDIVRRNLNNPKNIRGAIQRLNYNVAETENRKAVIREEMRRTGDVGVSYTTIRARGEMEKLFTNFYHNKTASGLGESEFNFIQNAFSKIGIDFKSEISDLVTDLQNSGIKITSDKLFDIEVDVALDFIERYEKIDLSTLSDEDAANIQRAINLLRENLYI